MESEKRRTVREGSLYVTMTIPTMKPFIIQPSNVYNERKNEKTFFSKDTIKIYYNTAMQILYGCPVSALFFFFPMAEQ